MRFNQSIIPRSKESSSGRRAKGKVPVGKKVLLFAFPASLGDSPEHFRVGEGCPKATLHFHTNTDCPLPRPH